MSRTIIVEDFREFTQRHGGNGLRCGRTGVIVFSDGASVQAENADMRDEPPDDHRELLKVRRLYYKEAVKLAEQEFHSTQQHFCEAAAVASRYDNLPGPPADAAEILETLAQTVREHRETLAEIERQLVERPSAETKAAMFYQEQLAQSRARAGEQLRTLQNVNI